jgi:ribosomal protein L11 methyltransferase
LKWLEVSLIANGEVAEAAADVLARHAPAGLALESVAASQAKPATQGSIRLRAYLPMDDQLEARRARIEEELWHLSQIMPIPQLEFQLIEEEDWAEAWKESYRPIPVGDRLLIQPSWLPPAKSERAILYIDPEQAFGTGTHPSTRLCLLALEQHLRPGDYAYDLGCGSGILAIAAARLGAARVRAYDIDILAVTAAQKNAERNGVEGAISIESGSLAELLQDCSRQGEGGDILLANILAPVLETLIHEGLAQGVKPGGKIILSGILAEQAPDLCRSAEDAGLRLLQVLKETDWQALVLERTIAPD